VYLDLAAYLVWVVQGIDGDSCMPCRSLKGCLLIVKGMTGVVIV